MGVKSYLNVACAALALIAGSVTHAQYASELGKLAPEALKPSDDRKAAEFKQAAPDIYFYWNDASSNSLVWVTDEGVMVVDSQQHPADARRLLALVRKVTDKPIKWLVVSHAHGDHFLGNPVFKKEGATIVSQRDTRAMMQKYYKDEIQRRIAYFKMHDLDPAEIQILMPEVTFDSRFTIYMGGKTAELIHLGPAQNPGDTLIHFPHARLLFLGRTVLAAQLVELLVHAVRRGLDRGAAQGGGVRCRHLHRRPRRRFQARRHPRIRADAHGVRRGGEGGNGERAHARAARRDGEDGEVQGLPQLPPHARLGVRATSPARHRKADGAARLSGIRSLENTRGCSPANRYLVPVATDFIACASSRAGERSAGAIPFSVLISPEISPPSSMRIFA